MGITIKDASPSAGNDHNWDRTRSVDEDAVTPFDVPSYSESNQTI